MTDLFDDEPRECRAECSLCDEILTGYTVLDLAKSVTKHQNAEHGDELAMNTSPYHVEEYDRRHMHGNEYSVTRIEYYITVYDVLNEDAPGLDERFAVAPDDEDLCHECWKPIADLDDAVTVSDSGLFKPDHRCRACEDEYELEERKANNHAIGSYP